MIWINFYGLLFMAVIMVPNIVFEMKCRDGFKNLWENKVVQILEQAGRFCCVALMIFIIPGCRFGFSSDEALALYIIINSILVGLYCLIWIICFRKNSVFRALALSVLPSAVFLFSGIMSRYAPLIAAAVIFAPCHILISYKNAVLEGKR